MTLTSKKILNSTRKFVCPFACPGVLCWFLTRFTCKKGPILHQSISLIIMAPCCFKLYCNIVETFSGYTIKYYCLLLRHPSHKMSYPLSCDAVSSYQGLEHSRFSWSGSHLHKASWCLPASGSAGLVEGGCDSLPSPWTSRHTCADAQNHSQNQQLNSN